MPTKIVVGPKGMIVSRNGVQEVVDLSVDDDPKCVIEKASLAKKRMMRACAFNAWVDHRKKMAWLRYLESFGAAAPLVKHLIAKQRKMEG